MKPPKAEAPMKTGKRPMRPVRASGKASAAKAIRWTSLSLLSAWGGWSRGQSIATVSISVTMRVRGMSRFLRIKQRYCSECLKATSRYETMIIGKIGSVFYQRLRVYDNLKIWVVSGDKNQKIAYRLYKWSTRLTLCFKSEFI